MSNRKTNPRALVPGSAPTRGHQLSPLEDLVPVRLVRTGEIVQRIASLFYGGRYDLRVTDLRILNVLHADEEIKVVEISRRARVDKAWISRLVRELEGKGLVERRPDPRDQRAAVVSLTAAGRALQDEILPLAQEHEARGLGGIDRETFVAMLDLFELNCVALLETLERRTAGEQGQPDV